MVAHYQIKCDLIPVYAYTGSDGNSSSPAAVASSVIRVTMITKLLEIALEILTDFGAPAIGVLLIAHMYYEWRFKKMQNKQDETDINVISLENDTMKNVNEVRSESQKRLDYIVDRLHSGEASAEEVQALLVKSMIALKTDFQESYLTIKEFRRQQHDDIMHNAEERAASSRQTQAVFDEIRLEFRSIKRSIEELRGDLNAFMEETRMRFTDDHKGNGAERQAIWGVVHEMKEEIRKLQSTQDPPNMFQEYQMILEDRQAEQETRPILEEIREIPEENDLSIQDQLVNILKQDGLIPKEQTGDSGEMLNHVFFGPVETTEEIEEEDPRYLIPIREEEESA